MTLERELPAIGDTGMASVSNYSHDSDQWLQLRDL